jgi:hypothetical protein
MNYKWWRIAAYSLSLPSAIIGFFYVGYLMEILDIIHRPWNFVISLGLSISFIGLVVWNAVNR